MLQKPYLFSDLLIYLLLLGSAIGLGQGRPLSTWLTVPSRNASSSQYHHAFPVVKPDSDHTKLVLVNEGLDAISRIKTPVAAVVVIGPFRSGKSFLLNQLLSLSCNDGFGVGHLRDTKTKGIWVWGEPLEVNIAGVTTSVLFLDTEGFESIGKSNVYDDRIFALAAIMSSVLVYNLPETVREADIARLSFAVELAEEFYSRVKGRGSSFQPAKLLWLIQRDFLEGKSVQDMVNEALQQVPNPGGSKDIDRVNRIRDSLTTMADNSTAFSLPQPHLQRTKLCEMNDADLEPEYVRRREHLKEILATMIKPKIVQERPLTGKDFSLLLEQTLDALNKGEIPSAGSVVEAFNRAVVDRCMKSYSENILKIRMPTSQRELKELHDKTADAALALFEKERFGRHHESSVLMMKTELDMAYHSLKLANEFKSSKQCEKIYSSSEDKMDELQDMRIPSISKFTAVVELCNKSYEEACIGPSKALYQQRMQKMLARAKSKFINNYNNKLFNWLVIFSLVMVVVGRFFAKFFLLEAAAWTLFIFLETYTRIFWSAESLFYSPAWQAIVSIWEAVVYSPVLDLDRWLIPLSSVSVTVMVFFRVYRGRKRVSMPLLPGTDVLRTQFRFRRDA